MKKIIFTIGILFAFSLKAQATGIADIGTIADAASRLSADAAQMSQFARQLLEYNSNGFIFTVDGSTQTVALTPLQKQGLIAQYQNLKAQMAADFQLLP
jgi:hypothetical protein